MAYDDEFDLDDEGLEGFDGDDAFEEMEDPFDTKDDRDPATKVAAGMMEKAVSLETAASVANTIADNALPEGFKVAKGATEDLVKEAQELYDKTQETLKGPTKRLKKVANRAIKNLDFLPEGIKDKLLSFTEVEEDGDGGYSQGNSDQAAIQASIGSIFGLMDEQTTQAKEQNEIDIDKEKVEKKRFETTSDYQSRIAKATEQQTAYTLQVQSGYQRKMLELQHLQYFALRDNLVLQKGFTADAISNLRQITKNTGLPEFVKLRMSENYAQLTRERLMGKANETVSNYTSKFIGNFKERAVGSIDNFVADISTGIEEFADMAETMQDMSEDMEGMGQDKWKMAGEMITSTATGWAAKKFGKWLGERLEKNPEWARKNEWLLYNAENFPALISEWAQSDSGSDNFFIQQFKELIPTIGVDQENMISNLADKGTDISMFDEMTRRSIVEIIPGYLSRILKSTEDLRTGVDTDRVVYSADREEFTTISKEVKNLRDRMFSESSASRALTNAMNVVDAVDPDGLLDKDVRRSLMKQIVDDARAGKTAFKLDDYINERKEFEGAEEVANLLRETVETTEEEGEYGETILKAKNSRKNLHLQRVISKEQRGLSDVFKNVQGELGKMNAYGTRDIGRSLGILGKNADGKDVVDFERLRDIFFEQGETGDILDRYSDSLGDRLSEKEDEDEVDLDSMNIIQRKKYQLEEKRRKREEEKKKAKEEEAKKRKIVSGGSDPDYIPSRVMGSGHSTINANIDMSETNGYLRSLPDNLYEKFMNFYNDKRAVPVHVIGTDIDFSEVFKNGPGNNPSGPSDGEHPLRSFLEEQLNLINAQLGTLNETAASSMHISMGDPSEFAEKMGLAIAKHTAAINDNWKRVGGLAKGTAQAGLGMMGTWYRFLGRSASTLFEKGSELADIAGGKISKGYDWLTEKGAGLQVQGKDVIQRYKNRAVDLYVQGRDSPLLSNIKMAAGEYRDSVTGKVVKSIEDIKGAVLDTEGNIVATIEDLQKGLYTPDGELVKFKEVKNRIGGFVKGVGNTLGSAYSLQFNMIAKARDILMDQVGKAKDFLSKPMDIYVRGSTTPRLLATVMGAGGYFSSATGKPIFSIKDIDGDVVDANGNVVLTLKEMTDGIFDKYGVNISAGEFASRLKNIATLGFRQGIKLMQWSKDLGMSVLKKGGEVGREAIDTIRGSKRFEQLQEVINNKMGSLQESLVSVKERASEFEFGNIAVPMFGRQTSILENIYRFMIGKWGEGVDYSEVPIPDGPSASYEAISDTLSNVMGKVSDVASSASKMASDKMEEIKDSAVPIKDKVVEKVGSIKDAVSNIKKEDVVQKAVALKDTISSEASERADRAKAKIQAYREKASGVASSVVTSVELKAAGIEEWLKAEHPQAYERSMEGLLTTKEFLGLVKDKAIAAKDTLSDTEGLRDKISERADSISSTIKEKTDSIKDTVSNIKKEDVVQKAVTLKDAIKEKTDSIKDAVSNIKKEDVIQNAMTLKDTISSEVSGRADSISSAIKEKVGSIHNPFQVNLGDKIAKENEGPINSEVDPDRPRKATVKDLLASILKRTPTEEERKYSDSDGDGMRDGSWQSQRGGEKVETDEDGQPIIITQDGKEKPDFLTSALGFIGDKITGAIGNLGSIISGALGLGDMGSDIIDGVTDVADLGGKTKKGGKLARLGRGALKVGKGLGRFALGAGKLGLGVAKAGFGVAKFGLNAARFLGGGLLSGAQAFAVANPITAAVLGTAAVAYGGYKLYKYFSGRSAAKGVDELRFLQYGIDVSDKDALGLIRKLEEEVEDNIEWKDGQPVLTEGPEYFIEEFAEMFGVDMENQAEVEEWANWFSKRFIPIYMTYLSTANTMFGTEDISDIEDDASEDQDKYKQYISMVAKPDGYGPEMGNPMDIPAPSIQGKEPYNGGREVLRQRLAELVPDAESNKTDPGNAEETKKDKVTAEDVTAVKEKAIEDLTANNEVSVEVATDSEPLESTDNNGDIVVKEDASGYNEPTSETKAIKDNVVQVDFNKAKGTAIDEHPEAIDNAKGLIGDRVTGATGKLGTIGKLGSMVSGTIGGLGTIGKLGSMVSGTIGKLGAGIVNGTSDNVDLGEETSRGGRLFGLGHAALNAGLGAAKFLGAGMLGLDIAKIKKMAMEQATETTLSVPQSSPEPLSGNPQISNVVSIDTARIAREKLPAETVPDTYQDIDTPKPVEPKQTSKIVEAMDAPAPRVTGAKEEVPLSETYLKRVASASERSSQLDFIAAKQRERMIELLIAIKDDQRAYANFMLEKNGVETDKVLSKPQSQASKASMPEVPKELAMPMDLGKKAM